MSAARRRWTKAASPWKWLPLDAAAWSASVAAAVWASLEFELGLLDPVRPLHFTLVVVALQVAAGVLLGVYLRRFVPGSFDEARAVLLTGFCAGAVAFAWTIALGVVHLPRSVPLTATALAVLGMLSARFLGRAWVSSRRAARPDAVRIIVFGAGAAGRQLISHMQSDSPRTFDPVALLDDDCDKRRLRVSGVRVLGTLTDLVRVAEKSGATAVAVALPSAGSDLLQRVTTLAEVAGLKVLVLPPLHRVMQRQIGSADLREVDVYDLLGRRPVRLEEDEIAASITGKRVLVTGAGGSIGSELCRQLHRFNPAELVLLDRDESALHAVQLSLQGKALLNGRDTVLADIRDGAAIHRALLDRRPDVVFHTAALKHLPLLEEYALEAWMTNVVGTWNVLSAANDAGVSTFVNISTDKAANPTSVLGMSKRVTERLTAGMAVHAQGCYVSVRFGNVLGSRGSVLTGFERQVATGGPVTVTHPEVTRFFMTIAEACQLVLQAGAVGEDGEVLVLDMGDPVKILDVARTLIDKSSRDDVAVVFTGLRQGEKLHEELFGHREQPGRRPRHPLISHVVVPPLLMDPADLSLTRFGTHSAARAWFAQQFGHVVMTAPAAVPAVLAIPGQRTTAQRITSQRVVD